MAEHIRIGDVAPRVQYVGDGARTDFAFPFPIFDAEDLELRIGSVVLSGGYAVTGAGENAGGMARLSAPPASGETVTLRRRMTVQRATDFQDNGLLRARTLNDELDRLVAVQQEQREEIGATLRQDPGEVGGRMVLPLRTRARTGCSASIRTAMPRSSRAIPGCSPPPSPARCRARSRTRWESGCRCATSAPRATASPMTGRHCRRR